MRVSRTHPSDHTPLNGLYRLRVSVTFELTKEKLFFRTRQLLQTEPLNMASNHLFSPFHLFPPGIYFSQTHRMCIKPKTYLLSVIPLYDYTLHIPTSVRLLEAWSHQRCPSITTLNIGYSVE